MKNFFSHRLIYGTFGSCNLYNFGKNSTVQCISPLNSIIEGNIVAFMHCPIVTNSDMLQLAIMPLLKGWFDFLSKQEQHKTYASSKLCEFIGDTFWTYCRISLHIIPWRHKWVEVWCLMPESCAGTGACGGAAPPLFLRTTVDHCHHRHPHWC